MGTAPYQPPILKFVRRTENASTPTRGSPGSAGFDLYRYFCRVFIKNNFYFQVFI